MPTPREVDDQVWEAVSKLDALSDQLGETVRRLREALEEGEEESDRDRRDFF